MLHVLQNIEHEVFDCIYFYSRLENITGFRIVVDKIIQTHQNAAGKPEPDK